MTPEQKLQKISDIFEVISLKGKGHLVSTDAHDNLWGALIDLERTGKADEVVMNTLRRVRKQLAEIRRILK